MTEIDPPTNSEATLACCIVAIATLSTELPKMAERGALDLRAKVLNDPTRYQKLYHSLYPSLWDCLKMWRQSFMQRLTRNPEYGRNL